MAYSTPELYQKWPPLCQIGWEMVCSTHQKLSWTGMVEMASLLWNCMGNGLLNTSKEVDSGLELHQKWLPLCHIEWEMVCSMHHNVDSGLEIDQKGPPYVQLSRLLKKSQGSAGLPTKAIWVSSGDSNEKQMTSIIHTKRVGIMIWWVKW